LTNKISDKEIHTLSTGYINVPKIRDSSKTQSILNQTLPKQVAIHRFVADLICFPKNFVKCYILKLLFNL